MIANDNGLEKLPRAIREGVIDLGCVKLKVYVLDDGRRLVDSAGIQTLFDENSGEPTDDGLRQLALFTRGATDVWTQPTPGN